MGWYYGYSTRQALAADVTRGYESEHLKMVCLKKSFSGNDLWTVWERTDKVSRIDGQPSIDRFICLFMLHRYKEKGGDTDWGYKEVSEDMGPFQHSCPLSFLDMVPEPTRPEGYHDWRAAVREYWAKRNQKIVVGRTVRLTNGKDYKITKFIRRKVYGIDTNGCEWRIPRKMLTLNVTQEVTNV